MCYSLLRPVLPAVFCGYVVWRDPSICVTWLIYMYDMTYEYVCHNSFTWMKWGHSFTHAKLLVFELPSSFPPKIVLQSPCCAFWTCLVNISVEFEYFLGGVIGHAILSPKFLCSVLRWVIVCCSVVQLQRGAASLSPKFTRYPYSDFYQIFYLHTSRTLIARCCSVL